MRQIDVLTVRAIKSSIVVNNLLEVEEKT